MSMRTGGASCAMMTETEKDRIWKIARNCGLLTKQPGTNAFDEALFAFVETVVRPTGGYLATGWTQDGMESRYCIDKRDADYFASFHPRNGTERMRNPNAKPGTVKALYVINNE